MVAKLGIVPCGSSTITRVSLRCMSQHPLQGLCKPLLHISLFALLVPTQTFIVLCGFCFSAERQTSIHPRQGSDNRSTKRFYHNSIWFLRVPYESMGKQLLIGAWMTHRQLTEQHVLAWVRTHESCTRDSLPQQFLLLLQLFNLGEEPWDPFKFWDRPQI